MVGEFLEFRVGAADVAELGRAEFREVCLVWGFVSSVFAGMYDRFYCIEVMIYKKTFTASSLFYRRP